MLTQQSGVIQVLNVAIPRGTYHTFGTTDWTNIPHLSGGFYSSPGSRTVITYHLSVGPASSSTTWYLRILVDGVPYACCAQTFIAFSGTSRGIHRQVALSLGAGYHTLSAQCKNSTGSDVLAIGAQESSVGAASLTIREFMS